MLGWSHKVSGLYQHHYYHSDGGGNVTALVNGSQVISARYLYDPYGNLLASSGGMAEVNALRFSSQEWHENSGLYGYAVRFYEPRLGRWLNGDPLREGGGINLYQFCGGDPVNRIDPWGLDNLHPDGSTTVQNALPTASRNMSLPPGLVGYPYSSEGIVVTKEHAEQLKKEAQQQYQAYMMSGATQSAIGDLGFIPVLRLAGTAAEAGVSRIATTITTRSEIAKVAPVAESAAPKLLSPPGITTVPSRTISNPVVSGAEAMTQAPVFQVGTASKQILAQTSDDILLGIISKGEVQLFKPTAQIPGHSELVAAGLVPKGAQGFSIVVKGGEITGIRTGSFLNETLPGFNLPNATFIGIQRASILWSVYVTKECAPRSLS